MSNKLRSFVVVSSILAGVGCSAADSDGLLRGSELDPTRSEDDQTSAADPPGRTGNKGIIGGKADFGDPAVVAVIAYTNGGKTYSSCTGEIIAGDVVLTASHCIDARALGFVPEGIQIRTSQDMLQATAAQIFPARSAIAHPAYSPQTGANDIAVVLLQRVTNIAPLPYNRTALEGLALDGKPGRAIGYGTTKDGDSSTAGKKNEATLKLSKINPFDFTASALPATQCHGDSGGPVLALVGGKEQIIGIGWITVRTDGLCAEGVRDTRVDKYLSFIDPFVKAAGGGAAPAPAPGAPGAPGGGGNPSTNICCYNGQFYDCPTSAACLGGFDINACLDACTTAACQIACTQKLSGKTPTNQCTRTPQKDATCNGG